MWHAILQWFHFNYLPDGQPFYTGATWGNVFVLLIVVPAGWLWSKTKFWPLKPLKHVAKRIEDLHTSHKALHDKIDDLHGKHDALHELVKSKFDDPS